VLYVVFRRGGIVLNFVAAGSSILPPTSPVASKEYTTVVIRDPLPTSLPTSSHAATKMAGPRESDSVDSREVPGPEEPDRGE
jgi:hypothetical protein